MSRPVGRRCKNRHRHAWVVSTTLASKSWRWCEDCGALAPNEHMARRKWAYPGDREKALAASATWEAGGQAVAEVEKDGGDS